MICKSSYFKRKKKKKKKNEILEKYKQQAQIYKKLKMLLASE